MKELIEKLEQLKNEISNEDVVKHYLEAKKAIFNDAELISKIEEYHRCFSEKLKQEIMNSSSFLVYKEKEVDVNILILAINEKFKELECTFDCRKGNSSENY